MMQAMSLSRIGQAAVAIMLATFASNATAHAQVLSLQLVASGLTTPVGLRNAGDGSNRLFIVNQAGIISIYTNGQVLTTPFLDVSAKTVYDRGERGLLGLAFDPSYATNGLFYIYYTSQPAGAVTISRYSVSANPNVADPNSEVVLKTQAHSDFANHNGGTLLFGTDGCLYAGIGDGGSGGGSGADPNNNAQNLGTLLGKIIRISPVDGTACTAAPGNPFVGMIGALPEIWALGVRNPWRITMDRQTGDLWIADVGEATEEEVDLQPQGVAGRNYCWSRKEGTLIFNSNIPCMTGTPTDPIIEYDHSGGRCAIMGGYRYRGIRFPRMVGTYFYADLCTGQIYGATLSGGVWTSTLLYTSDTGVTTFGEDEAGDLYIVHGRGTIHRLVFGALVSPHDFNGDGMSDILWRNTTAGDVGIWLMNGTQTLSTPVDLGVVPTVWQIVGTGDFNGDSKKDILWRNTTTGDMGIWLMNGTQTLSPPEGGPVPSDWSIVGTGDFNGDGMSDILWRNTTTGDVGIWLMNGTQTLSPPVDLGVVPSAWSVAGTGDFNGDGMSDILWRNTTTGDVGIWLMNGTQTLSPPVDLGVVPNTWQVVGTGDFNGDGMSDILWRNTSTGDLGIWLMNGTQTLSPPVDFANAPNAWSVAGTGDFNGDGKSDILWRNTTTGDVGIWLMNGTQTLSPPVDLGSVPTSWVIQGTSAN
jgi:glucose/arabinose dehydrogenase